MTSPEGTTYRGRSRADTIFAPRSDMIDPFAGNRQVATGWRGEELQSRRAISATMAIAIEGFALGEFSTKPPTKRLVHARKVVATKIDTKVNKLHQEIYVEGKRKRPRAHQIDEIYIGIARETVAGIPRQVQYLFRGVDRYFGTDLFQRYRALPIVGGECSFQVRYLLDAALALAEIACRPFGVLPENRFIYDVSYRNAEGKEVTQFDGIVISRDGLGERPVGLDLVLDRGLDWTVFELKSLFRTQHVRHGGAVKGPRDEDVRFVQDQLAKIFLTRTTKPGTNGEFHLPQDLVFCYLRGRLPRITHRVPVNSIFVNRWIGELENQLEKLNIDSLLRPDVGLVLWMLNSEHERLQSLEEKDMQRAREVIQSATVVPLDIKL